MIDCFCGRCERLQDTLAELRIKLEALHTAAMERDKVDGGWLAHEIRMALAFIGGRTHEQCD